MSGEHKSRFIIKIYELMHQYQKNNNIKGQCIQNCQFLYDCITTNNLTNVKPKVAIVAYNFPYEGANEGATMYHIHMVLQDAEGNLIDPSYEVAKIEKSAYHTSVKEFMEMFIDKNLLAHQKENIKSIIKQFLKFLPFEEKIMNRDDGPLITDRNHYNLQADYVEAHMITLGLIYGKQPVSVQTVETVCEKMLFTAMRYVNYQ